MNPNSAPPKFWVHPDILKLGFVSFLTDLSSEMIFSVFAIFFTSVIGGSAALLGLIEGLSDLSSCSLNYYSGWLSDRTGKRKSLAMTGYGFSSFAKVILLFSSSLAGLGIFRVIERLGKSFRGPPRDAWLSSVAHESTRGYAFGVHKALDKAGAVLGPLFAYGLLSILGEGYDSFIRLFWIALIPAILSVLVLSRVKDQPGIQFERENMFDAWRRLGSGYKNYLISAGIFSLAYFSFGFLLLRAYSVGFKVKDIILLYALFNISFVIFAPIIGKIGDQVGRVRIIALSYFVYFLMSLGFAFASQKWEIIALFVCFGLFFSIDEAQSKAYISDLESERRASAIGLYNFATGLIYLPASAIAGSLWLFHPSSAFYFSASISLIALVYFVLFGSRQQ